LFKCHLALLGILREGRYGEVYLVRETQYG